MKLSSIWSLLGAVAPEFTQVCRAVRSRRRSAHFEQTQGPVEMTGRIAASSGMVVQAGPFRGIRFPEALRSRGMGPKLLGTYERELHACLQDAIAQAPDKVVIIGSAEGYYAVGLGRAIPGARVQAFDIDPWARQMCVEVARLNGVEDRLEMGRFGRAEHLNALEGVRGLIVSDCEGFEYELFSAEVIGHLRHSLILIETHAHLGFDDEEFKRRFAATHSVETIAYTGRKDTALEGLAPELSAAEVSLAINEFRPEIQHWLYARPLAANTGPLAAAPGA